jgi:hypothetical protein
MDVNGDGMADLVLRPQNVAAGLVLVSQGTSQGSLTFTRFSGLPSCMQPWGGTTKDAGYFQWGDFNGDGRADFICAQSPATNNRVYISTGGFSFIVNGPSTTSGKLSLNTTSTNLVSPGGTAPNASYSILDFNGDGRSDVLRISDNASLNAIYISNGDGTFTQSTTFTFDGGAGELTRSDGTASFVIGDFTGRGNVEFLRFRRDAASATTDPGKNLLYVKADPKAPDLLRTVTSGTGLVTQITRATMASAGDRYVSDRAPAGNPYAAAYPNVDLTAAMPIVTAVEEATGVGTSTTRTDYAYRGFKGTYTGRGALGFREMRVQRPAPNGEARTVVTRYLQEHPYIGVAAVSQTYLGDLSLSGARLISRTTNSYCDKTAQASPTNIGTPGDAPNPCVPPSSQVPKPLIQRPFLYQSVEEGWDPATIPGITLPKITTTNTYNDAADPLQIEVVTEGTALGSLNQTTRRTTTNVYDPDTTAGEAWRLGRLQRTTVNAQVPNSLPSITTAAGSSPHATERQGTGSPTGTLNPAVLSAILQLLLDD